MTNKVVHIVYSFGCGGLEKVIANLINHSSGYDVEHIIISLTEDISMSQQLEFPVKTIVLDKQSGNDLSTHRKIFSLLKEIKPQAINTYNFGTIEYHLVAKLAGVPIRVHSDHGRGGDDPQGKNKLHNLFRKFIGKFITEYIVVSFDLYQWIADSIKIDKNKLALIFNGVVVPNDIDYVEQEATNYVTVGRLDKVKNQELLINAFAKAVNEEPGFSNSRLNIVGDGPLYSQLQSQISELNMDNSIKLLGFRDDITNILAESDVFVLSSVYEAMPMTILEAMANKTPVICTNVGGISQFITEEQAWFVESKNCDDLANKLKELSLCSPVKIKKIDEAYNLVKENYALDKMVKEYMSKYKIQLTK